MTKTQTTNTRELILGILLEVTEHHEYSHIAIRKVLEKYQYLDKKDRGFITRITEGTLEQLIHLDYIIEQFSTVKVKKMKPVIRNILRMSVYQLKFMDSVPPSAVCNEAVKLSVKKGFKNLKGFVNGVLRNISRNMNEIKYPDEKLHRVAFLSIKYSMPEWIIKQWMTEYGNETLITILESFFSKKNTSIRCNLSKITKEELVKGLQEEGIEVGESRYLDDALEISGYDYLGSITSFQEGLFQVQDVSSMLAGQIGNPKKEDYVIDVCAAPGGKSLHAADKLMGTGHVEARDITDYKVSLIQDNIKRCGFKNIEAVVKDARVLDADSIEKADVLFADLPCSGLGVMGKKNDLKYKMTPEKQKELVKLQQEILNTVHAYVKKGGTLVYSTCTINKEENIENVNWFIRNYPFELESIDPYLPEELKSHTTGEGYLQLLPGVHECDGFFIARLRRAL